MQFLRLLGLLALLFVGVHALAPEQQVLITFPNNTPQSEIDSYKTRIEEAKGTILHEYQLIKGFVVKASTQAIESIRAISAQSAQYQPIIEDDSTVTTQRNP